MADPVWLLLMFDLPVKTRQQRKRYTQYRKMLLDLGFTQTQLSVYSKYLVNAAGVRAILPWVRDGIPAHGAVRMIRLTDDQWAGMYRFYGPEPVEPEPRPEQLALFPAVETDVETPF